MAPVIPIVAGLGAAVAGASSAAIAGSVALGATGAFLASGGHEPPPVIDQAPNPIANRFPPIDFTSIFDEISRDRLEIIRGTDGRLNLRFSNDSGRIDLDAPVQSRDINTRLPAINRLSQRASEVVALSQAMTRLGNEIEQMENTSPYLIAQNQELINSFRRASEQALDRGFDFRQYAIDQKLAKYGLDNSSTAFGVQVALAREKANAYADLELKQAELAQGLKQQSLANLHQRGQLLGENANVELNRFTAESQNQLANEEMTQRQVFAERQLEGQNEERRLATEFGNRRLADARRQRMAQLGLNVFNSGNSHALSARGIDNSAIAQANADQLNRYDRDRDPLHDLGMQIVGNIAGNATSSIMGGSFGTSGFNANPFNNLSNRRNNVGM